MDDEFVIKKKKKKFPTIAIILLVIVILGIEGYIIYDKFIKKDIPINDNGNNNQENNNPKATYTPIDSTKDIIYYIPGDEMVYEEYVNGKKDPDGEVIIVHFDIPVININDSTIINTNQKMRNTFQSMEKEIKKWPNKLNSEYYYCYDEKYCSQEVLRIDSKLHEDDKYLIIQIITESGNYHGSGSRDLTYYSVSKETYKLMSKKDILDKFNTNEDDMIKLVKRYFQKKLEATSYKDQEKYLDESMQYTIYKDKILITFDWFTGTGSSELLSDGKQIIEINYDEWDNDYFK